MRGLHATDDLSTFGSPNCTDMSYFTKDYVKFFKDLAANNNRDWFQANKKRYEESVKNPFEVFIQDLIKELAKEIPAIKNQQPKNCIFRIYRDVRFGKDKTPYKLNSSAIVSEGGRKDHSSPGMYVELGPNDARVYGGVHMSEKEQLHAIRTHIMENNTAFEKALSGKAFMEVYGGELHGEKNKILPPEFKAAAEKQPYLFNKGFYYFTKMKSGLIATDDLMKEVMKAYKAGKPMQEFFQKAIGK